MEQFKIEINTPKEIFLVKYGALSGVIALMESLSVLSKQYTEEEFALLPDDIKTLKTEYDGYTKEQTVESITMLIRTIAHQTMLEVEKERDQYIASETSETNTDTWLLTNSWLIKSENDEVNKLARQWGMKVSKSGIIFG